MSKNSLFQLPDMPEKFEQRIEETLNSIIESSGMQPEHPQTPLHVHTPRRISKVRLGSIIVAAALIFSLTALAVGFKNNVFRLGMYERSPEYLQVQQSAYPLVQYDLGKLETEHLLLSVKEGVYDGQELRIVLSVIDKTADAPFTGDPWDHYRALSDKLKADNVRLNDGLEVNGEYANPWDTNTINGEKNGELLLYTQVAPFKDGIELSGEFEVTVTFWGYENKNDPSREISFTLNADDALPYAHTLEPFAVEKDDLHIQMGSALFTPMRGSLELRLQKEGVADGWELEQPWLHELKLYLSDGSEVLGWLDGWGADRDHPETLVYYYTFVPPVEWSDTMRLAASDDSGFDIEVNLK